LSGKITLSLAGERYDLDTGDAVHFDSRLPHRVTARGKTAPEILVVASPLPLERSAAMTYPGSNSRRAITLPEKMDYALEGPVRT
jgi:quercetin dioxygenase-like cupin family protein